MFIIVLMNMGKEQSLKLLCRKILASGCNYNLVLDLKKNKKADLSSMSFYVENHHFTIQGLYCQLCGSMINECAINENSKQEFGDLMHFLIHFAH